MSDRFVLEDTCHQQTRFSKKVHTRKSFPAFLQNKNKKLKEVIKVVLLDELKLNLTSYEEPLKDLRDSL